MMVGAAAALSVAVLAGSTGVAAAAGSATPPTPSLPTVTVTLPPLPLPTPTVPVPVPTPPAPVPSIPGVPSVPPPGGGSPGGGGSADPTSGAPEGSGATSPRGAKGTKPRSTVKPMIAGRPEALDVVDDESTPALYRASKSFLAADSEIAALIRERDAMDAELAGAQRAESSYASLQTDGANARARATTLHLRYDRLHRVIVTDAVQSYQAGHTTTDDASFRDLVAAAAQALDDATRAELAVGSVVAAQDRAKVDFDRFMTQYFTAQNNLGDIDRRLEALAEQRAAALAAAQAAKSGDLARNRQSIAESGQLGAAIRAASARLAAAGRTVQGTGHFIRPSSGAITSPYGMRMHPILHYVKLHTGTDFAVGDGYSHAADNGRVLFTIVSVAYGNFTVIDHGTIDGRHITTAYAHQAKFLVQPGDVVAKGQKIGIIGATGYATGPHLHFEVRDDGAVEDPMSWLS
jgi:murein DD-endopeptidase MepM/ murein hydrolase activator NlpD